MESNQNESEQKEKKKKRKRKASPTLEMVDDPSCDRPDKRVKQSRGNVGDVLRQQK